MLKVGDEAPDFELRSHRGGTVKLSDFRGKRQVVVAFHPLAFTPVCAEQMCGYESDLSRFEGANAAVLGISVDAQPAKAAWAKILGPIRVRSPQRLPSARGRRREVRRLRAKDGISERAIFVVGTDGRITWAKVYDIPQQPDNAELLEMLKC